MWSILMWQLESDQLSPKAIVGHELYEVILECFHFVKKGYSPVYTIHTVKQ